jgi:hypothetical protein
MPRYARSRRPKSPSRVVSFLGALALVVGATALLEAWPTLDSQSNPRQPAASAEREEVLGEISADANMRDYNWAFLERDLESGLRLAYYSLDRRSVVWFEQVGNRQTVRLNGRKIGDGFLKYPQATATISEDGRHVAVQGYRSARRTIVFDGNDLSAGFDEVFGVALSPDGQRLAYGAKSGKTWALLVNGERRADRFDTIPLSAFSVDGAHLAYAGRRAKAWVVGVDGQEQAANVDEVLRLWVDTSGRLTYAARRKFKFFYVIDGKEGDPFDILGPLVLSPDGRRYAYGGARAKTPLLESAIGRLVVDGRAGPEYSGEVLNHSSRMAMYGMEEKLKQGLLESLVSSLHGVSDPAISPDGQHVAHTVRQGNKNVTLMLDDRPLATLDWLPDNALLFSGDSAHLAAIGIRGNDLVQVRDGDLRTVLTLSKEINFIDRVTWSPNRLRWASVMGHGGDMWLRGAVSTARRRAVVDGHVGPEFNCVLIVGPVFSADSTHWGYEALFVEKRAPGSFVVVDGVQGKIYDEILPHSLQITGDTAVYLARDGRKFVRVTRPLTPSGD